VTPILMTALGTALGVLPLAIQTGQTGREIQGPMAIVILGGLITSTVASLVLLPSLIWCCGRAPRPDGAAAAHESVAAGSAPRPLPKNKSGAGWKEPTPRLERLRRGERPRSCSGGPRNRSGRCGCRRSGGC